MKMEVTDALPAAELPAELELERVGAGRFQAHHRNLRREAVQDLVEPSPESNVEFRRFWAARLTDQPIRRPQLREH
jgi:hypothetical protein